jgi:hypothetical protein
MRVMKSTMGSPRTGKSPAERDTDEKEKCECCVYDSRTNEAVASHLSLSTRLPIHTPALEVNHRSSSISSSSAHDIISKQAGIRKQQQQK